MYLTSTGMVCAVGLNSESACAAMRAGISGFAELPYKDNAGQAIVGAAVPDLDPKLSREERLLQLLKPAIRECTFGLNSEQLKSIPLLVGLAEPVRSRVDELLKNRIISKLEQGLGIKFFDDCSRVIPTGRTAGFEALYEARRLLQTRQLDACLICGADSYINARMLDTLDRHWRLKQEQNSDGVIPGEAAAALMLRPRPDSSATRVRLAGLGFGTEDAKITSDETPLLGLGLTNASKVALSEAGLQMHEIDFRISDVTGESFGFKEQALVIGRLLRVHREERCPIWHCAEFIGDTGAAAGIIQLILAFHAFRKRYSPGETTMCFTSGDSERRAVAVLTSDTSSHSKVKA